MRLALLLTLVALPPASMTLEERLGYSKKARERSDFLALMSPFPANEYAPLEALFKKSPDTFLFFTQPVISDADSAVVAGFKGEVLALNQVNAITANGCAALSKWPGRVLILSGLEELDAPTAAALAKWKGEKLFLDGVAALDAKVAKELSAFQGKLISLRGLKEIPPDAAAALKPFKGAIGIKLDQRKGPAAVTGDLRQQLIAMDRAITSGDVEAVRAFLKGGGDPNINEHGTSLIIEACDYQQVAIVKLLLEAKAEVNGETRDGETALTYALKPNDFDRRAVKDPAAIAELTTLLLKAGANPNPPRVYATPLALAAAMGNTALIAQLLKAGAKVDGEGPRGGTALLEAVNRYQPAAVEALLKAGANANGASKGMGLNPFHRSLQAGPIEIDMVSYRAKGSPDPKVVAKLRADSMRIIELLLSAKADVNALDDDGNNALHLVAVMGGFDETALVPLAQKLIKLGARKTVANERGQTPAAMAAEKKRPTLEAALR